MLTDRTRNPLLIDKAEPSDRAMLVLQYVTAVIAVIAAGLLAQIH
jgi:3-deoxy-D-arabino-heptulosonate 7-phosphate (DAHP) synthase